VTDIENQWAWNRVEAMADHGLSPDEHGRMRDAMAVDPELDRAVQSAVALRHELRRLAHLPAPTALGRRLLAIPSGVPSPTAWLRLAATSAAGFAAAAAVAVAFFLWLRTEPGNGPPPEVARASTEAQAVEDFVIAMTYLQKSATIANAEMTAAVGGSLNDALSASRDKGREQKRPLRKNGG
jgi:hypothetical protein